MISLLLPTRQRPLNLLRLAESIHDTANDPGSLEIVTYMDHDDKSYEHIEKLPIDWVQIYGPRNFDGLVNLSAMWNKCYEACGGNILMHCGDDIVFRTDGWDDIVRESFDATPDNILFAYGRDGYQDAIDFGTHGFIHRTWVETVGYFVPPYFVSDYNDTFLNDVAKSIDRHQKIPIYTEHMHYINGKAEVDQNTRERLERHALNDPRSLYYSAEIQSQLQTAAEKLRAVIHASDQADRSTEA